MAAIPSLYFFDVMLFFVSAPKIADVVGLLWCLGEAGGGGLGDCCIIVIDNTGEGVQKKNKKIKKPKCANLVRLLFQNISRNKGGMKK